MKQTGGTKKDGRGGVLGTSGNYDHHVKAWQTHRTKQGLRPTSAAMPAWQKEMAIWVAENLPAHSTASANFNRLTELLKERQSITNALNAKAPGHTYSTSKSKSDETIGAHCPDEMQQCLAVAIPNVSDLDTPNHTYTLTQGVYTGPGFSRDKALAEIDEAEALGGTTEIREAAPFEQVPEKYRARVQARLVAVNAEIAELRKDLGNSLLPNQVKALEAKFAKMVLANKTDDKRRGKLNWNSGEAAAKDDADNLRAADLYSRLRWFRQARKRAAAKGKSVKLRHLRDKIVALKAEIKTLPLTDRIKGNNAEWARERRAAQQSEPSTHSTTGWMFGVKATGENEGVPEREYEDGRFSPSFKAEWKKLAADVGGDAETLALGMLRLHERGELQALDAIEPPAELAEFWERRGTYFGEKKKTPKVLKSSREHAVEVFAAEMDVHVNVYRQHQQVLKRKGQEAADAFLEANRDWQPHTAAERKATNQRMKDNAPTRAEIKAGHDNAVREWLASGVMLARSTNPDSGRERNTYHELPDIRYWGRLTSEGQDVGLSKVTNRQLDLDDSKTSAPTKLVQGHYHVEYTEGWIDDEVTVDEEGEPAIMSDIDAMPGTLELETQDCLPSSLGDIIVQGSPKVLDTKLAKTRLDARLKALNLDKLPADQKKALAGFKDALRGAGEAERKAIQKKVPTTTAVLSSDLTEAVDECGKGDSHRLVQLMALGMSRAEAVHVVQSYRDSAYACERVVDEALSAADNRRGVYLDRAKVLRTLTEREPGKMLRRRLKDELKKIDKANRPPQRSKAL